MLWKSGESPQGRSPSMATAPPWARAVAEKLARYAQAFEQIPGRNTMRGGLPSALRTTDTARSPATSSRSTVAGSAAASAVAGDGGVGGAVALAVAVAVAVAVAWAD